MYLGVCSLDCLDSQHWGLLSCRVQSAQGEPLVVCSPLPSNLLQQQPSQAEDAPSL